MSDPWKRMNSFDPQETTDLLMDAIKIFIKRLTEVMQKIEEIKEAIDLQVLFFPPPDRKKPARPPRKAPKYAPPIVLGHGKRYSARSVLPRKGDRRRAQREE